MICHTGSTCTIWASGTCWPPAHLWLPTVDPLQPYFTICGVSCLWILCWWYNLCKLSIVEPWADPTTCAAPKAAKVERLLQLQSQSIREGGKHRTPNFMANVFGCVEATGSLLQLRKTRQIFRGVSSPSRMALRTTAATEPRMVNMNMSDPLQMGMDLGRWFRNLSKGGFTWKNHIYIWGVP